MNERIQRLNTEYNAAHRVATALKTQVRELAVAMNLDYEAFMTRHAEYVAAMARATELKAQWQLLCEQERAISKAQREADQQKRQAECEGKTKAEIAEMMGYSKGHRRYDYVMRWTREELIQCYVSMV